MEKDLMSQLKPNRCKWWGCARKETVDGKATEQRGRDDGGGESATTCTCACGATAANTDRVIDADF